MRTHMPLRDDFSLLRLSDLWALDRPDVLWRHDVDNHLALAVRMAHLERAYGIRAVYYLHADTDEYPCHGAEFDRAAQKIIDRGHELGTHVDLKLPRDARITSSVLAAVCEEQASTLRVRWPVADRVSLHRPPHDALWRDIPGFQHALAPVWQNRYSSDSRRRFRTSPERLLLSGGPTQVNLHPCWWLLPHPEAVELRRSHQARALVDDRV